MLVLQCKRRLVADFCRAKVLNGTRIYITCIESPVTTVCGKFTEWRTIKFYKCFLYHRFHLTMTTLHIHHHCDWYTTCYPLHSRLDKVTNTGHISGYTCIDQTCSIEPQCITIVCIEVRWIGTAPFVSKEVVKSREFAIVFAFGTHLFKTLTNHFAKQLLGLDKRYLYIAVGIAIKSQLARDTFGQSFVSLGIVCTEMFDDPLTLCLAVKSGKCLFFFSEKIVEFGYQTTHCGYKLDKALWDKHCSKVVALCCTCSHNISQLVDYILQGEVLCLNLLRNDANVRLGLKCTFKCNMTGATPHKLYEVPIFFGAIAVSLNIAYNLAVYLCGCIETKRGFNQIVLQVAVNGLRAAYNLYTCTHLLVVFGKHGRISVAIVTANDDKSGYFELLEYFETAVKLVLCLEFGTTATDNIKTTCISIFVYDRCGQFNILVFDKPAGSHNETEKTTGAMNAFDSVKKA